MKPAIRRFPPPQIFLLLVESEHPQAHQPSGQNPDRGDSHQQELIEDGP